jgi:hypothetical protein
MTGNSVMIEAECHKCKTHFEDFWVTRNFKGDISLEGIICSNCGTPNCIHRVWKNGMAGTLIPPAEDGNINRFEYSYTTPEGKKVNKKIDPKIVEKHFELTNKGADK